MRTVAIIQARMGSSRLPGKVLAEAAKKPLLLHMIERLERCETLDRICVAVADEAAQNNGDDPITDLLIDRFIESPDEAVGWTVGSIDDVLGRVLQAATI